MVTVETNGATTTSFEVATYLLQVWIDAHSLTVGFMLNTAFGGASIEGSGIATQAL